MNQKIEETVLLLASMINQNTSADEALKYTQAACNLANAGQTLAYVSKEFGGATGMESES